ncbi:Uncharacterised protein [Klebsiella pneumoniae]|nr:Uncharacterised protein [Klebsiella pneumoniae]
MVYETLPVDDYSRDASNILHTNLKSMGSITYSLYKRDGECFRLIDIFSCYAEANEEAKKIICECENFNFLKHT